ncbi:MAG: HAMP domain-containing sensor histidine kinase, partial [Bdellovibrionales bacterium]
AKLNPTVFNYGIFALAEAAFMLSFSFVPREYLSVTSASALHFSLRVLSDMALLECLNSVLKINRSLVSFMRIGFTAGLLWFGYLYMHQGTYPEFVFATEVVSVLIIAVPLVAFFAAIQAWNADRHLPVKKENNLIILIPTLFILTYSQIHDTMMFWGLFSGVYYVKFYLAPLAFALAVVLVQNQIRTFESLKKSKAEADKDAILGRIAWEFSHDLKSPLGALHDSALLALNDSSNQDYTKAVLESVVEKTTLVSSRIQQLFNYAKDQIQKKEKNNIKSLLNEIKSELEISLNAKNILLKIDVPDSNISVDAASIKRAIQNLVVNAIEASKENSEIHIQAVLRRNRIIFTVKDFGVGIDDSDLPHVFDPYFTKHKVDGTGLGLAIVDRISRQHGGFVQVFSKKDNGSTFVIEIPQ